MQAEPRICPPLSPAQPACQQADRGDTGKYRYPGMTTHTRNNIPCTAIILVAMLLAAGCATKPPLQTGTFAAQDEPPGKQAQGRHKGLEIASAMLGIPYHYGGASPRGFDCSGLVYYAYRKAGLSVPRTTSAQFQHAQPVKRSRLQPGDLVFFRLTSRPVSHVGIYAGDGRFIHAPSRGKRVSYASLDNPYWQQRIVAAGRY
jgi:cell wall-associated NlpC family hydrolase